MFHQVYQRFGGITRSIQLVLNRLYETEKHVVSEAQINEAILHIVNQSSMQYEELINLLTDNQQALMKAIAKEGCLTSPQSDEFIKRYNLPSASSVKTALDVLLDKDLVYRTPTGYIIYDHFLAIWLTRLINIRVLTSSVTVNYWDNIKYWFVTRLLETSDENLALRK